jgi:hypothetical protein
VQAQIATLASGKLDKAGGTITGAILPDADNSRNLGSALSRFAQGYFASLMLGGSSQAGASLHIRGAPGSTRGIRWYSGDLLRWLQFVSNAESTGNAGGQMLWNRYDDAGTLIDTVLSISRASGVANFSYRPTVTGAGAVETQNNKGQPNGYPPLGADNLVPNSYLPASGSYKGNWNASTNTPTVTAGTGTNGDEYTVSFAGTQSVTGSAVAFSIGDRLKFTTNGNKWERIPNSQAVSSVFGRGGVITPQANDYTSTQIKHGTDSNVSQALTDLAFDTLDGGAI